MSTKWQRTKVEIPKGLTKQEREAIAFGVIERMIERTQNGKSFKNGRKGGFVGYTKEYKKKKGSSKVDLTLSEDMLNDLQLLSHTNGSLLIGFKNGTKSNGKADGNIRGTYGQSAPIAGKARPFLGITKKDLNRIINQFKDK